MLILLYKEILLNLGLLVNWYS